jgi:hypothetical protein
MLATKDGGGGGRIGHGGGIGRHVAMRSAESVHSLAARDRQGSVHFRDGAVSHATIHLPTTQGDAVVNGYESGRFSVVA